MAYETEGTANRKEELELEKLDHVCFQRCQTKIETRTGGRRSSSSSSDAAELKLAHLHTHTHTHTTTTTTIKCVHVGFASGEEERKD